MLEKVSTIVGDDEAGTGSRTATRFACRNRRASTLLQFAPPTAGRVARVEPKIERASRDFEACQSDQDGTPPTSSISTRWTCHRP